MTSTLTGPFDLCVELTDAALSGFASPVFRDQTQTVSFPSNPLSLVGQAVLDIQSASIAAAPSSSQPTGATVTINFVDSTLAFTAPHPAFAEPLSGAIVVSGVPFALVAGAGGQQDLELDFTATSVSAQIHWAGNELDNSIVPAVNKAGNANLSGDLISGFLNTGMTDALQSKVGKQKIAGAAFQMAPPGKDGTLSPPTFTQLGVVTRAKTGQQPGVLGILATIFKSDDAPSQPPPAAGKIATATDSAHTGSLTISPAGFQNIFVFEANQNNQVPAGTSITTTLEEGKIGLHLAGTQSTDVYTANWTIDGDMLASISNGALSLQLTNVVEHVSVSLSWWVWVSEIAVGGAPLAGLVAEIQAQVKDGAMTQVQKAVSTLTTDIGQSSTAISGIPITFDHVAVHTQGIVLLGTAQLPEVFGTFVQGIVTDPNEVPIPGATVIINPDGESGLYTETTTDQNGRYTFESGVAGVNLDVFSSDPNGPEPYPITAAQPEYITGTEQVSINWGQIVTKDFVLQPVKDITVKGQVLGNGTPLEGAIVTLSTVPDPTQVTVGTSTPSDKQGMYTLTTNPGQTLGDAFTVSATAPGFNTQAMPIGVISNGGTVTENFTLATPHPFTVTGTVTGSYGQQSDPTLGAVGDAKIMVFPKTQPSPPLPTATGQTQTNGSYSVGPVNPGSYSGDYLVLVEAKLFEMQKVDVSQPTGASVEVDVELSPVPSKVPGPPVKPGTAM